jgi:hypothetical protein
LDRARGIFAVWDDDKTSEFMRVPGGMGFGYFPKGSKMPVLASYRRPTAEDGKFTAHWGGCVPGTGFQVGYWQWESGLVHVGFRRVQWPTIEGRPDWEPPVTTIVAKRTGTRIRAWWANVRRRLLVRRSEPTS